MNVILPCAGEGQRLGLPYPKEIHSIVDGIALIDLSFQKILKYKKDVDRVTIILKASKTQIIKYLDKYKAEVPIVFCYFNENYFDWAGSILSAEHLFTKKNMVLLPDSFLVENNKFELIPSMKEFLSKSHLTFGYLKEESARIRNLGALKLSSEENEIIDFCDKPLNNYQNFNAFWGTFGFTNKYASQILLMMSESIKKKPVDINSLGIGKITGFPINEYYDLGTWDSIHNFDKSKLNQNRSNLSDKKELITKQKRVPVDKVRENYSFAANG